MGRDGPANPLERPGYRLEFDDEFADASLDEDSWIPTTCHSGHPGARRPPTSASWMATSSCESTRITYTPTYGYFELSAKATLTPGNHFALWMIGYEDEPARSSEICICEVFGKHGGPTSAKIGFGVHPFGDPRIVDDSRVSQTMCDRLCAGVSVHADRSRLRCPVGPRSDNAR